MHEGLYVIRGGATTNGPSRPGHRTQVNKTLASSVRSVCNVLEIDVEADQIQTRISDLYESARTYVLLDDG